MVKVWRTEEEMIEKSPHTIQSTTTLAEARSEPAAKYVKTEQRYCKRSNAESYVKNKNFIANEQKSGFIKVSNVIDEKLADVSFNIRKIIEKLDITDLTHGDLIRGYVTQLICRGKIKKEIIKHKKGIRYVLKKANEGICQNFVSCQKKNKPALCCNFDFPLYGEIRDDFELSESLDSE
ncbi:MAG: hypothetical protein WC471_04315 [Candidatus Woesearchaeota archaeon]